MPDKANTRGRERAQARVQNLEMRALRVGDVARDMEGDDLALPSWRYLVHCETPFQHQTGAGGAVPLAHDVLVGAERLKVHRQFEQGRQFLVRQAKTLALELPNERVLVHSL